MVAEILHKHFAMCSNPPSQIGRVELKRSHGRSNPVGPPSMTMGNINRTFICDFIRRWDHPWPTYQQFDIEKPSLRKGAIHDMQIFRGPIQSIQ